MHETEQLSQPSHEGVAGLSKEGVACEKEQLSQQPSPEEIADLCKTFLEHLYHHDRKWCLEHFSPQISFIGSVQGNNAFNIEDAGNMLKERMHMFHPSNIISFRCLHTRSRSNPDYSYAAVEYITATEPSRGFVQAHHRTATMIWNRRPEIPLLRYIHLSTPVLVKDDRETVTLSNETIAYIKKLLEQRIAHATIVLRDIGGTMHYVSTAEIRHVEACKQRTILHCVNRKIIVRRGFNDLVDEIGGSLVTVHRSFAVNPLYVHAISSESILLDDGTRVPVPQRRSSEVQACLSEAMDRLEGAHRYQEVLVDLRKTLVDPGAASQ